MSKKLITIFVLIVAVIAGGVWWALSSSPAAAPVEQTPIGTATQSEAGATGTTVQPSGTVATPSQPAATPTPAVTPKPVAAPTPKPTPAPAGPKSYTLAEVAKHGSQSDCWSVVNGGVYNLTSWIDKHPGGAGAIISMCGTDGSAGFNDQHGGERRPANELAEFKIGVLAE